MYINLFTFQLKGLELFDVIRDIELLNAYDSQFYISSLLLYMEYLYTLHIVYRDIELENVMVDYKGYIHLIDIGTAKILKGKGYYYSQSSLHGSRNFRWKRQFNYNVLGLFIFSGFVEYRNLPV
ncbi:unnamed protein product [Paramecium primaurelia]|uniref:Protein kinase domain-containing protein n=1 Tax=Paramecium primaurelia TaxID=5886 RepID=A0A8S1MRL2_PARPR|nr:unnamed protein product [Paramecium primaurelia]